MAKEYIEREAFIADQRHLYCENCARRKGMKNGKMKFVYDIGEAPCRACDIGDMLDAVEDYPAADVVARDCYDRLLAENDALRKERPVVRCKDCRFCVHDSGFDELWCNGKRRKADWYCADGERSTNCGALMDKDGDA